MTNRVFTSIANSKIITKVATIMTIMCMIVIILFSVDLGKNIFPAVKFEWKIVALIINILAIPTIGAIWKYSVGTFTIA